MPKYTVIEEPKNGFYGTTEEAIKLAASGQYVVQVIGQIQREPRLVLDESVKKPRRKRTPKTKSYGMEDMLADRTIPINARCFLDGRPAVQKVEDDEDGDPRYVCMDHAGNGNMEIVR